MVDKHNMSLDLLSFDLNVTSTVNIQKIENLIQHISHLLNDVGTLIYTTHLSYLCKNPINIISKLGGMFKNVDMVKTSYSGYQTSEVYLVCVGFILEIPP